MSDPSSSKAIGSLAKKQSDVTRQGTQKLKFVPTLPQRRKKEEVKPESTPAIPPISQSDRSRGRGRGRGDGGKGRGRGGGVPPAVEMTASGPFAMGPAMAGSSSQRPAPRSNFVPAVSTESLSNLGGNLSQLTPPSLKKDVNSRAGTSGNNVVKAEDEEVYSDPDDGVEIVDIEKVRQMDWMAPESLRKDRQYTKNVKEEPVDAIGAGFGAVDSSNALDLSESEEEEELEDIIEDFAVQVPIPADGSMREDRLYFFQFPTPFPKFTSKMSSAMDVDHVPEIGAKKVSFAPDVKLDKIEIPKRNAAGDPQKIEPVDGVVGQLEIYKSGVVKIRLTNGILLDVNAATQPSFLQQAVYLNNADKQLTVLGEVNKQFVVSPNVDALLNALEREEGAPTVIEGEEKLLQMDQSHLS